MSTAEITQEIIFTLDLKKTIINVSRNVDISNKTIQTEPRKVLNDNVIRVNGL